MNNSVVRISKFLSLILRHQPDKIGLRLSESGWASVEELVEASRRHGVEFTLEELQDFVGGLIERVPLDEPAPFEILVNEEGLIHELPYNDLASMLAKQPLVGNAVVLSREEWGKLTEEDDD